MSVREINFNDIQELYLSEPGWVKSSSWVKPVPHRVYKVKTIWCEVNKFDTEVHRRYRHFIWLRKMLIREFEHWAVPVLPEKTIFERVCAHKSDFIKERMRKMKHFLTLLRSHKTLKESDYFKTFLCESDQIFKSTIKNLTLLEEDKIPVVQKAKGWFSAASESFGNIISKANKMGEAIIPSIKNLLSSSDELYDSGDLLVKKYSEKLELLHQSFIDVYKLATEIHARRSEECKVERGFHHALDNLKSANNESLAKLLSKNAQSSKIWGDDAYKNLVELEELLYATESHIVWIESVQDLIERKNSLWEKLLTVQNEMKESPLNHHEIESWRYLLDLTKRRDKIIRGIRKEMEKLSIGTKDFYPRYIETKFIKSQLEFYTNSLILYQ